MRVLVVSADRSEANGFARNLGDALLTDALVDAFAAAGHDARALDLGEGDRSGGAPRIRASGIAGLSGAIGAADVVVFGGGTLFADDQPDALFAGLPRLAAVAGLATRAHRRRFASFGVGVDPVSRRRARLALRAAAGAGPVWVRDRASVARLAELTGHAPHLGADVSLLGAAGIAVFGHAEDNRRGAVIALNRTEAAHLSVEAVERLAARYGAVRFVSMHQGEDSDAAALPAAVKDVLDTVSGELMSWQSAAGAIGGAEAVIASRMHAMYLAAMTGTPVAALAPTPKTRAFAEEFGVPVVSSVSDAVDAPARVSPPALQAAATRGRRAFEELLTWLDG